MARKPKDASIRKRPRDLPQFISKSEMAGVLRCSVGVLTTWIRDGHFPPPDLYPEPGRKLSLWRLEHFLEFTVTGEWPEAARAGSRPDLEAQG